MVNLLRKVVRFLPEGKILLAGVFMTFVFAVAGSPTDSLAKKLSIHSDEREKLSVLGEIVSSYWKVSPDSSIKYGLIAVETAAQLGDESLKADALSNLGVAYFYANSFDNSLKYLFEALKIRETGGDTYKIGTTLNSIGNVFYALGDNLKALDHYNRSLKLVRSSGNKKMEASILTNLGSLLASMGEDSKAFENLNLSIQLLEQLKDSVGISSALNNLSLVYREKGLYSKAINSDERALQIVTNMKRKWDMAYISNTLGETYLIMKNYQMAEKYFTRALTSSEELGSQDVRLFSYRSLTRYYSAIGEYAKFDNYFQKYEALKDSIFTTENTQSLAEMQVKYQTEHQAKENAIQKLQIAKERDLRNSFIFISILVLIAVVILFIRYRNKKRKNEELEKIVLMRTRDLSEREERYRKLISASPDAVIEADINGFITFASQQSRQLFRTDKEENLWGARLEELIAGSDADRFKKHFQNIGNPGSDEDAQFVMVRKDGSTFSGEVKLALIYGVDGTTTGIIALIRNITERKQVEQRILRNTIETEERERARFSEDLHDGLGPLLSTVKIHLELISARKGNPEEQEKFIQMTDELLQESIRSTREIANNLTPNLLNDFGLLEALSVYIDKINMTNTIHIDYKTGNDIIRLMPPVETALYRVLCELINNTLKHASATQISIEINCIYDELEITYKDNGIGFDVQKMLTYKTKGLGLSNIISRMRSVNGTCTFISEPGKNFTCLLKVKVPMPTQVITQ